MWAATTPPPVQTGADVAIFIGALAGALVAIITAFTLLWQRIGKPLRDRARVVLDKVERIATVVLGHDGIPDDDRPGEFLRPPSPDMGVRMSAVEDTLNGTVVRYVEESREAAKEAASTSREALEEARAARQLARRALIQARTLRAAAAAWHHEDLDVLRRLEEGISADLAGEDGQGS